MPVTARRFHCARCHAAVLLCRACDRGNRYCLEGCAGEARAERQRRNAARYRRGRRARLANAARQARHRARAEQKVTHRCSPLPLAAAQRQLLCDWFVVALEALMRTRSSVPDTTPRCAFCDVVLDPFLRAHFLRPSDRWRARARSP